MRMVWIIVGLVAVALPGAPALGQEVTWDGTWRGTLSTPGGVEREVSLTIVEGEEGYGGVITGFGRVGEIRLSEVATGDVLVIESATETDFGPLAFRYELAADGEELSGGGEVTLGNQAFAVVLQLTRARRADVVQPQVEQGIDYFSGRWTFDYTGGEFPPLSVGTRSGEVRFTRQSGGPFVEAHVTGELYGDAFEERWSIGFDEATRTLVWRERLSDGEELLSLGDWTSPIGITFLTAPVEADGRVYVLRRVMRVTSDTSFSVTDEFSVDGGPFRRLGDGAYLRAGE